MNVTHDGDGHADHAEMLPLRAVDRVRQAAQRQDEQDRRDQIEKRGEGSGHVRALTLSSST